MLSGLLMLLMPVLPGLWIMWIAALVYLLVIGINLTSGIFFGFITVLIVIAGFMDNIMMGASAKGAGASWLSIGVALVGAIVGSILLPPFGGLLFGLAGIFLVEFLRIKDWRKALESTKGLAVGCGWSVVIRFGIGLLVFAIWLFWVLAYS